MKILILHLETSKQFMLRLIFLILISSLSTAVRVHAQKKVPQLKAKVDSILDNRYFNSKYDTNYISRPSQRLTLKLRTNLSGNEITSERRADGETFRSKISTDNRLTFSVGRMIDVRVCQQNKIQFGYRNGNGLVFIDILPCRGKLPRTVGLAVA